MRTFQNLPYFHLRLSPHHPTAQPPAGFWWGMSRTIQISIHPTPPFSLALDKGCHSGEGPACSPQWRRHLQWAWPQERVVGDSCQELPFHWLPSLSCWYLLCSWRAGSNKGRCIPSTQVSTRAFPTEPPSDAYQLFPPVSLEQPSLLDLYGGTCPLSSPRTRYWQSTWAWAGSTNLAQTRILCSWIHAEPPGSFRIESCHRAPACPMFSVCPRSDLGSGK